MMVKMMSKLRYLDVKVPSVKEITYNRIDARRIKNYVYDELDDESDNTLGVE